MVNFGEVRRVQLAKSTLLTTTLGPLGSFQIFKIGSDPKEGVGCGKQREAKSVLISLSNIVIHHENYHDVTHITKLQTLTLRA